jgi:menaquinone-9 beta-reductase
MAARRPEVIVVGGGPAGAVMAWDLARRGIRVLVVERARFPREKVCGDYVEPRGLRIIGAMGALPRLEAGAPLPITDAAMWIEWVPRYAGPIPFYGRHGDLPPHGFIVPREVLDTVLLEAAEAAGAVVEQETAATGVRIGPDGVEVETQHGERVRRRRAQLVVGADGVNSVVARAAGLLVDDERYIAVARRAYAIGAEGEIGEAIFCFDHDLFPGYGWAFPMSGGRLNVGVGILAEMRRRFELQVPELFDAFVDGLRRHHPRFGSLELAGPPIGGIVKTYGGAGPNHFDRAVLIGDAGSFVDPMTGEGITPGMESALLAAPVLAAALEVGRFGADALAPYESAYRDYFDPGMRLLTFTASLLRNRHMAEPWLKAFGRGCELAQADVDFARTSGGVFGGLDVRPAGILSQMSSRIARELALAWPRFMAGLAGRWDAGGATTIGDLVGWQSAWWRSFRADPLWHTRWAMDVQREGLRLASRLPGAGEDPRIAGPRLSPWRERPASDAASARRSSATRR